MDADTINKDDPISEPSSAKISQSKNDRSPVYSTRGRIARLRFTLWLLAITLLIGLGAGIVVSASKDLQVAIIIALLLGMPLTWMTVALVVNRLHDVNLSAWHLVWVTTVLVAPSLATPGPAQVVLVIGSTLLQLWLVFKRGTVGPNRYGPDTRGQQGREQAAADDPTLQQVPKSSGARWVALSLITLAVIGVAAIGISEWSDGEVPTCSDPGVTSRVAKLSRAYVEGDIVALFSGGPENLVLSTRDVRTLSNNEPLHGRTCVATVDVTAKAGPQAGKGALGSRQINYTVQIVDGQRDRYVVSLVE